MSPSARSHSVPAHIPLVAVIGGKYRIDALLAMARFLREARTIAALRGEHVARVLDSGCIENGPPYMVLEYLEGAGLSPSCSLSYRPPLDTWKPAFDHPCAERRQNADLYRASGAPSRLRRTGTSSSGGGASG